MSREGFREELTISDLRTSTLYALTGEVHSGKTETIASIVSRARFTNWRFQIFDFDPNGDGEIHKYYPHSEIGKVELEARKIKNTEEISKGLLEETTLVIIDNAQFADSPDESGESLLELVQKLVAAEKAVIVAGLDLDTNGRPYEVMSLLLADAEVVKKKHAVCSDESCGEDSSRSLQREDGSYFPVCFTHWKQAQTPPHAPDTK